MCPWTPVPMLVDQQAILRADRHNGVPTCAHDERKDHPMRIARGAAFVFTAMCLVAGAVALLGSTTMTFCTGSTCRTVDCGSPAFPKAVTFWKPCT